MHSLTEIFQIAEEMKPVVRQLLKEAGLLALLDEHSWQCLGMEDGLFLELVFFDGHALEPAETVVAQVAEALLHKHLSLESVVRAKWAVSGVENIGTPSTAGGGIIAATDYRVHLSSGTRNLLVTVRVSNHGIRSLLRRLASHNKASVLGSNQAASPGSDIVRDLIRDHVRDLVSGGGRSAWDPRPERLLTMRETDLALAMLRHPASTIFVHG